MDDKVHAYSPCSEEGSSGGFGMPEGVDLDCSSN
jgi:hypothetical protein